MTPSMSDRCTQTDCPTASSRHRPPKALLAFLLPGLDTNAKLARCAATRPPPLPPANLTNAEEACGSQSPALELWLVCPFLFHDAPPSAVFLRWPPAEVLAAREYRRNISPPFRTLRWDSHLQRSPAPRCSANSTVHRISGRPRFSQHQDP